MIKTALDKAVIEVLKNPEKLDLVGVGPKKHLTSLMIEDVIFTQSIAADTKDGFRGLIDEIQLLDTYESHRLDMNANYYLRHPEVVTAFKNALNIKMASEQPSKVANLINRLQAC